MAGNILFQQLYSMPKSPLRVHNKRLRNAESLHQRLRSLKMPAVRSTILQKQADGRAITGTFVLFADADVLAGIGRRILINDMADFMGQGKGTLVDRLPVWIVQHETLLGIRLRGPVMRPFAAGYDCNAVVPAVGQQPVDYFVHRHHSRFGSYWSSFSSFLICVSR